MADNVQDKAEFVSVDQAEPKLNWVAPTVSRIHARDAETNPNANPEVPLFAS